MGKLFGGIYGRAHGKVGNLVHYQLNGEDVVRLAGKTSKPASQKQKASRLQMAMVIGFLKPINDFIKLGYFSEAKLAGKSQHNMAVSYLKCFALQGEYPDFSMDYSKVIVAKGALPVATDASVERVADGLKFSWAVTENMDWSMRRHRALLLAYFPNEETAIFVLSGATRFQGTDTLFIPDSLRDARMETYLSFAETETNEVANSIWCRQDSYH